MTTFLVCSVCNGHKERDAALASGWIVGKKYCDPRNLVIRCPDHIIIDDIDARDLIE